MQGTMQGKKKKKTTKKSNNNKNNNKNNKSNKNSDASNDKSRSAGAGSAVVAVVSGQKKNRADDSKNHADVAEAGDDDQFSKDTAEFAALTTVFNEKQAKLEALLAPISTSLGALEGMSNKMTTVSNLRSATSILLTAAGFLPYVGPAFKYAKTALDVTVARPLKVMASSLSKAKKTVGAPFSKSIKAFMDKVADASDKIQGVGLQVSQMSLLLGRETFFMREIVCTAAVGSGEAIDNVERAVHALVETMRDLVGMIESLVDTLTKQKGPLFDFLGSIRDVGKTLDNVMGSMNALKPISDLMEKEINLPVFGSLRGKETKSPLDKPYCTGNFKPEAGRCYEKCKNGFEGKTLDRCWSVCNNRNDDAGLYCNTPIKNKRDFSWNMNGWKSKKKKKWKREDGVGFYKKCEEQYGDGFLDGRFGPPRFW